MPMDIQHPADVWEDPDTQSGHGILLSDRIAFYAHRVRLIDPFDGSHLGPASYDLSVGADCWYAEHSARTGESRRVLASGEQLIVEPNSIVYICSLETLNLPFYVVARFNLKVRLVHEGLLVVTGPQIGRGFAGRL